MKHVSRTDEGCSIGALQLLQTFRGDVGERIGLERATRWRLI
jgi:hypothetical protein